MLDQAKGHCQLNQNLDSKKKCQSAIPPDPAAAHVLCIWFDFLNLILLSKIFKL
jgi:hypothetical protein